MALDRHHAARAWCIAIRLKEQAERLGVSNNIVPMLLENAADLEILETEIQATTTRLAASTGLHEASLELLVIALENYSCGSWQPISRWQF